MVLMLTRDAKSPVVLNAKGDAMTMKIIPIKHASIHFSVAEIDTLNSSSSAVI